MKLRNSLGLKQSNRLMMIGAFLFPLITGILCKALGFHFAWYLLANILFGFLFPSVVCHYLWYVKR